MSERRHMTITQQWGGYYGLDGRIHATKGRIVAVNDELLHRYETIREQWLEVQDEIARLKSVDYVMPADTSQFHG
jgi:hypothetical protein